MSRTAWWAFLVALCACTAHAQDGSTAAAERALDQGTVTLELEDAPLAQAVADFAHQVGVPWAIDPVELPVSADLHISLHLKERPARRALAALLAVHVLAAYVDEFGALVVTTWEAGEKRTELRIFDLASGEDVYGCPGLSDAGFIQTWAEAGIRRFNVGSGPPVLDDGNGITGCFCNTFSQLERYSDRASWYSEGNCIRLNGGRVIGRNSSQVLASVDRAIVRLREIRPRPPQFDWSIVMIPAERVPEVGTGSLESARILSTPEEQSNWRRLLAADEVSILVKRSYPAGSQRGFEWPTTQGAARRPSGNPAGSRCDAWADLHLSSWPYCRDGETRILFKATLDYRLAAGAMEIRQVEQFGADLRDRDILVLPLAREPRGGLVALTMTLAVSRAISEKIAFPLPPAPVDPRPDQQEHVLPVQVGWFPDLLVACERPSAPRLVHASAPSIAGVGADLLALEEPREFLAASTRKIRWDEFVSPRVVDMIHQYIEPASWEKRGDETGFFIDDSDVLWLRQTAPVFAQVASFLDRLRAERSHRFALEFRILAAPRAEVPCGILAPAAADAWWAVPAGPDVWAAGSILARAGSWAFVASLTRPAPATPVADTQRGTVVHVEFGRLSAQGSLPFRLRIDAAEATRADTRFAGFDGAAELPLGTTQVLLLGELPDGRSLAAGIRVRECK